MMNCRTCLIVILDIWLIGSAANPVSPALAAGAEPSPPGAGRHWEIESESLTPLSANRQIDTVSLHILRGKDKPGDSRISHSKGVTITRAWGYTGHPGALRDNSAVGIGPVCLIRYKLYQGRRAWLSFDLSGGLIFYNDNFPAGGDFYNFMWRAGPKVSYPVNGHWSWNAGYKWMHVSNGQKSGGSGRNPGYDAAGFSFGLTRSF